jgi:hypothetical protein
MTTAFQITAFQFGAFQATSPPRFGSDGSVIFVETLPGNAGSAASLTPLSRLYGGYVVNVGEPAVLFVPSYGPVIGFKIVRPDGSYYSVLDTNLFYSAVIGNGTFLVYQTAAGELDQQGWWQVTPLTSLAQLQSASGLGYFVFYIFPSY